MLLGIIDFYLVKLFLAYFLGAVLVFASLFLGVDFTSTFVNTKGQVPFDVILKYYRYYFPTMVHQIIPFSALVASVFTMNSLKKHNELVALFSAGVSLARISAPILLCATFFTGIEFWLSDQILPTFNSKRNFVYFVEIKKKPSLLATVKTNRIWYRSKNVIFNLQTLNPEENRAQNVSFYYFDEGWQLFQVLKAKEMRMEGSRWNLLNGEVNILSTGSSFPESQKFEQKSIIMEGVDFKSSSNPANTLRVSQLRNFIEKNRHAGLDTLRYEISLHSRISFAFSTLLMALLGIPFMAGFSRFSGTMSSLGKCLGLAFGYWILYSSGLALGRHGIIPVWLAAWAPNFITLLTSFSFLLRINR